MRYCSTQLNHKSSSKLYFPAGIESDIDLAGETSIEFGSSIADIYSTDGHTCFSTHDKSTTDTLNLYRLKVFLVIFSPHVH